MPETNSPAAAAAAKNATEPVTIELSDGVELAMLPIPGKDYRMGRFPVTQAQYEAVTGGNPSEFKGSHQPVEMVSWADCKRFLEKLNATPAAQASGLAFRLPEEDEWEYACRAGAEGRYCKLTDGTEITVDTLGEVAWFDEDVFRGSTHPVGRKKPNAFGLYDMHGNVSEWTDTAVDEDGLADAGGKARVTRGGALGGSAKGCASSNRRWFAPSLRSDLIGFRLCADRRAD